ncbi:neprilysin-2 isoform X2 [Lepeophtheirus salmonis]|nr:neprilysin-2-like isoform X2 [Lepeophtheirus salmonis]
MEMEIQQVPWWNRRTRHLVQLQLRGFFAYFILDLLLHFDIFLITIPYSELTLGTTFYSIRMEKGFCIATTSFVILAGLLVGTLVGVVTYGMDGNEEIRPSAFSNSERIIDNLQTTAAFAAQVPSVLTLDVEDGGYYISSSSNYSSSIRKKASIQDYCMSKGCITTASEILRNMDESVDPCEDFYRFSCGGFIDKTIIPDDRTRMSSFSVLSDELLAQVRYLLESESLANEPRPFRMAKDVYNACMNKEQIEVLGQDPIKNILDRLGGWPVIIGDSWNNGGKPYVWYKQVYMLRRIGYSVDYLVDFSVAIDLKNSSRRILDLDQPRFVLDREYLIKGFNDEDVQAYYEFMMDVARFFGANENRAAKDMKEVLELEMKLANFSLPRENRRNATKLYNPMTIKDLTKLDPFTPWLDYINNILSKEIIQVNDKEVIIVNVPSYIKNFSLLINNTSDRVKANYLLWRVVSASIKYLNDDAKKISLQFSKKLTGKTEETPRWRTCVDGAKRSLTNAVGAMYIRKYFKEESRKSACEMVKDIRIEFDKILNQIDWMDAKTKAMAKKKANSIVDHIGYPPELLDDNKLEELYDGLQLGNLHYLENALNMTVFVANYAFSLLREKVNKTDWVRHGKPAIVNAFYSPLENSIQFPAGILQGIFFSSDRPRYMNYGAIGWVIGHEITHGFDDQGRQFDLEGNLVDWWHPTTKEQYLKKAKCIIEQYGNYFLPELNITLNGINTQGENIADNGGIKEAYRAYVNWVDRNEEEKLLPGLNYSQKQLFWVSAANVWCAKFRPKALKLRVLTGVHSPDMFRVRGPFSNMPEFARDFNCPKGSHMNPAKRCEVW